MNTISTKTKHDIFGYKNAWSLSQQPGYLKKTKNVNIDLQIKGNDRDGYHLIIHPSGFFAADYWYETKVEAINNSKELFDVEKNEWEISDK